MAKAITLIHGRLADKTRMERLCKTDKALEWMGSLVAERQKERFHQHPEIRRPTESPNGSDRFQGLAWRSGAGHHCPGASFFT